MSRIKIFEKLSNLERRMINLKNLLHDVKDHYTENVYMGAEIVGKSYNRKYENGGLIEVDKKILSVFVESQIKELEKQIYDLMGELK